MIKTVTQKAAEFCPCDLEKKGYLSLLFFHILMLLLSVRYLLNRRKYNYTVDQYICANIMKPLCAIMLEWWIRATVAILATYVNVTFISSQC